MGACYLLGIDAARLPHTSRWADLEQGCWIRWAVVAQEKATYGVLAVAAFESCGRTIVKVAGQRDVVSIGQVRVIQSEHHIVVLLVVGVGEHLMVKLQIPQPARQLGWIGNVC